MYVHIHTYFLCALVSDLGVADSYELPCRCWEVNPGFLEKQSYLPNPYLLLLLFWNRVLVFWPSCLVLEWTVFHHSHPCTVPEWTSDSCTALIVFVILCRPSRGTRIQKTGQLWFLLLICNALCVALKIITLWRSYVQLRRKPWQVGHVKSYSWIWSLSLGWGVWGWWWGSLNAEALSLFK